MVGANGSGKSTLFLHLNGTLRPSRGTVRFRGRDLDYSRCGLNQLRRRVGLVFQDPDSQLFSASVEQDISFGPLNMGLSESEVRQRVEKALQATGIADLRHRPVHALSYGQKKRVCIAGVYAMSPEMLILDEPLAWLDAAGIRSILALLDELNQGDTTVVVSLHQMELALQWADHVIVLQKGRAVFQGLPFDLFSDPTRLAQFGLEVPWPLDMFWELVRLNVLSANHPLPKDKQDLLQLIARNHYGN